MNLSLFSVSPFVLKHIAFLNHWISFSIYQTQITWNPLFYKQKIINIKQRNKIEVFFLDFFSISLQLSIEFNTICVICFVCQVEKCQLYQQQKRKQSCFLLFLVILSICHMSTLLWPFFKYCHFLTILYFVKYFFLTGFWIKLEILEKSFGECEGSSWLEAFCVFSFVFPFHLIHNWLIVG